MRFLNLNLTFGLLPLLRAHSQTLIFAPFEGECVSRALKFTGSAFWGTSRHEALFSAGLRTFFVRSVIICPFAILNFQKQKRLFSCHI